MVQKIGCIRKPDGQARGIIYLPRGSLKAARVVVDADLKVQSWQTESPAKQPNSASAPKKKKKKDVGIAKIIMADCIYSQLNEEFGNRGRDTVCQCRTCASQPPLPPRLRCDCSKCQPEPKPKHNPNANRKCKEPHKEAGAVAPVDMPLTDEMRKISSWTSFQPSKQSTTFTASSSSIPMLQNMQLNSSASSKHCVSSFSAC
jgi:hypothetical protein